MADSEVVFTIHALNRIKLRGTTQQEVKDVLDKADEREAERGRKAKEAVFQFDGIWKGKFYKQKKVVVIYSKEDESIIVVTVYTYYGEWR